VSTIVSPSRERYRYPIGKDVSQRKIGCLLIFVAIMVFFFTAGGAGGLFGGAMLAAGVVLIIWTKPFLGIMALVIIGTIHPFLMMLIYNFTGSVVLLKISQVWKEMILLVLLVKAVERAFRNRRTPQIYLLDVGILLFLAIGGFYLLYPGSIEDATLFSKAMGLRADALFLLAYFIGRGIDINRRNIRFLLIAFGIIAFIVAIVAAAQFIAPDAFNTLFNRLGFSDYMEVQRGDQAIQMAIRDRGISGVDLPRASSLLLSDIALAFFTLLTVPLAVSLFFTLSDLGSKILANVLILASFGTTVLTVTRSAMVALVPSILLLIIRSRKSMLGLVLIAQAAMVGILIVYLAGITPQMLEDIFSPDESSVRGHVVAIEDSLNILKEEPFGRGLGTAGQIAQRFKPQGAITNESWYLQIATEIGVIPAVIFFLIWVGFAFIAYRRYSEVQDPWLKSLCMGMAGATVAFGLVGITLHVWEGLTISIIFWLLAGIVVRAPDLNSAER
jgi:hypothetical protein